MKRVKGGRKVVTGQIVEGSYQGSENRIHLFDGKFTTGFKVVSFKITPRTPVSPDLVIGKLSTEPLSSVTVWEWDDVRELAWAKWSADKYFDEYENIREDNMVVQDLWISTYNSTTDQSAINYEIVLEKYEFTAWDGAGTMVRNQSQAGPPA